MLRRTTERHESRSTRMCVGMTWAVVCVLIVSSRAGITVDDVDEYLKNNIERVMKCSWYASAAAASCVACILAQTFVMFIKTEGSEIITAALLHTLLAFNVSLAFNLGSLKNSPIEELLLSIYAGYCFYELFYLRIRSSLRSNLKMLLIFSVLSFILNSLYIQRGAPGILLILYFYSVPVPILGLPSLGSSTYKKDTFYQLTILSAHVMAFFHRGLVAIPLAYNIWTHPALRFEEIEFPVLLSMHAAGLALCFSLVETLFRGTPWPWYWKQRGKNKQEEVTKRLLKEESQIQSNKRAIEHVYEAY